MAGAFFARPRRDEGAGLCPETACPPTSWRRWEEQRRYRGNKPWPSLPEKGLGKREGFVKLISMMDKPLIPALLATLAMGLIAASPDKETTERDLVLAA